MSAMVSHRPSFRGRSAALAFALLILAFILAPTALAQDDDAAAAPPGLQAGVHTTYRQTVPVNIVFIGYDKDDLNLNQMKAVLPGSYEPIVRAAGWYGLPGRDMGLAFKFTYNIKFAGKAFEDDYFAYLSSIATPRARTLFQTYYNDQASNVLDIPDTVWAIDGPSAEGWLLDNAGRLGINPAKSYTVFLVNWYDRPDFQHHVYTKTDFADPDTGYNFGEIRESRKAIAWGGTHGRGWFYDLSAGPESWTDNWAVDFKDLDGDGIEDYRMPPIWEYTAGGYRSPSELDTDLGKVVRFVAINLLFTTSPIYDPLASTPGPEGKKAVHVEMMELDGQRGISGVDFIYMPYVLEELSLLQPYHDWSTELGDNRPPDRGASRALRIASGNAMLKGCWQDYGTTFAQLFCHFDRNFDTYVPLYGPQDYVAAEFAYHTTDGRLGDGLGGLLGYADDNWVDGTPSYVFAFLTASSRAAGYGFSTTTVHEFGHHFGLSHPHDGYDAELGLDYGPGGDTYFAWSGDQSDTIMSYFDVSGGFGAFDSDNMNRFVFAGYLNWANEILADIKADPNAASVSGLVASADAAAKQAQTAFRAWNYPAAAAHAWRSYQDIARAAMQLGISTAEVQAQTLLPRNDVPKVIDPIRNDDGN